MEILRVIISVILTLDLMVDFTHTANRIKRYNARALMNRFVAWFVIAIAVMLIWN